MSTKVEKPSLDFIARLLNSTSEGIWSIGLDGLITFVNQSALKMFGYDSTDQMIGRHSHELFHHSYLDGSHYPRENCPIYKAFQEKVPIHLADEVLWRKDGTFFYADYSSVPIFEHGTVVGAVVTFKDNTELRKFRKKLEASESKFRAFADSTPTIIFTTTADGGLDYINRRWYEYSGLTPDETLGWAYVSALHPEDVENTMIQWNHSVASQIRFDIEHRFRRSDGTYRWFTVKVEPKFENNLLIRWYGTMSDIHEQKMFVKDLAQARDQAEQANETKSAFLANMSHEIRTPLGAILGFTDLLKAHDLDWDEGDRYLETISRNGRALTKIIDDILDLAKVESGKLDTEKIEFSLIDLIEEVLDLFEDKIKSKGIYLKLDLPEKIPPRICSDPTRLRQIFINIIGNAVKFTEVGGVKIRVDSTSQDDKIIEFKIAIQDTGVGVPAEQRSHLFQPFNQADNTTTRKFGGTGLGLVLSERLAHALGGHVSISDSEPGKGSLFTVSFLASQPSKSAVLVPHAPSDTQGSGQRLSLRGLKILIVDDTADNRFLVRKVLTNKGALVETANNGIEAVSKALNGDFNLVLMDIQMPKMDGYEATRNLRKAGYENPIIALTAHAMAEDKVRTRSAGCDGHLTKPLNQLDLIQTIQRHTQSTALPN